MKIGARLGGGLALVGVLLLALFGIATGLVSTRSAVAEAQAGFGNAPNGSIPTLTSLVDISIRPVTQTVTVGSIFTVTVRMDAYTQAMSGADVFIDFDPAYMQVRSILTSTAPLPVEFPTNGYNNTAGCITYSLGSFGALPFPTGTFSFITITMQAIAPTSTGASLTFAAVLNQRNTVADYLGTDVTRSRTGGIVNILELAAETSLNRGVDIGRYAVLSATVDRIYRPGTGETITLETGLGSYEAQATYASAWVTPCVTMVRVVSGSIFFDSPAYSIVTGTTVYSDSHTEVVGPQAPHTMAVLYPRLIGSADMTCTITNTFGAIRSVAGLQVPQDAVDTVIARRGDAKPDGKVDTVDAMFIAQYLAGRRPITDLNPLSAASVRQDGASGDLISSVDAMFIAQYKAGRRDANFNLTAP